MISNHTHERRVVERDERQLVVLHTMGQSDLQYVVQSGSSLQLDVVVIGDRAGMVDMTLAVQLADVDAAADVRVLALVQSARVRISTSLAIAPGAQQTDGKLVMRGLLLDDAASIAMTPGLDVAANDVSAGHGASIDHVDDIQRFYLETRGLTSVHAQRMIWRGLLTDAVRRYDTDLAEDTTWLESVSRALFY